MSLFISANSASASILIENVGKTPFIEELIEDADLVFRGTLTEISEALSIEEIPYTFVTYKIKEIISGEYSENTITLKFVGGEFPNGNRLSASNSPDVQLGEESILFVQQNLDSGCDFVRCEQGRFLLKEGKIITASESAIVVDEKGGIDYISVKSQKNGSHKSSLEKQNIPNFITKLKSIDSKFSSKNIVFRNTDKNMPFNAYAALTNAGKAPASLEPKKVKKSSSKGSLHDQWEVQQVKENRGNPILNANSPYTQE